MSTLWKRIPKINYLEILEQAWQDHLRPKTDDAPTVISTFAGGGGSSLGYSMAGYRELLAVEWDDNAVTTFKLNFPDVPVYHGDIAKLSVEECLELAGLVGPGELDLLDGSPPCQGFSTAGKRIFNDPRNQLFREYIRLLRGLKPKVFVMENVSGLVKGKMKLVFAEILRELRASGYKVSARLMNAMYFYVPQSRQRLIFIGVREDLELEPSHPGAESRPIVLGEVLGREFDYIGVSPERRNKSKSYHIGRKRTFSPDDVAYSLTKDGGFGVRRQDIILKYAGGRNKGNQKNLTHRVAQKVQRDGLNGSARHQVLINDGSSFRQLRIDELKRISSFPDYFQLIGSHIRQWERIGNSVPPLFMRSIARHIKDSILDHTGIQPELIS